jgi:23S rRNA (cytosine1962-C5)-methyltransferase
VTTATHSINMYPILTLKPGKEGALGFHHPWVFSGALQGVPREIEQGVIVRVADQHGKIIGTGTYSEHSMIAVRIFDFAECTLDQDWFAAKLRRAEERRRWFDLGVSDPAAGYRVIFGETDGIPGLVVDRYADILVLQIATAGTEFLKELIVNALVDFYAPRAIIERSDLPVRREEGLDETVGVLYGEDVDRVEFHEGELRFVANVKSGQKTGFFLDQRELRRRLMYYAADREVLNLFSYTGSFAVAALKAGARSVDNLDGSQSALDQIPAQLELNQLASSSVTTECTDVFNWVSKHGDPSYDMVIVDPPALIKSYRDAETGSKAYHFLNRAALRLMRTDGIFVTSSCSAHYSEDDFAVMLRRASVQAGVTLDILETVRQSADHPISIYFPESLYLKSFICQVRR